MTDRNLEEDAFSAGWNLVDEDGEVESVTSDDSSTMDFLVDRPSAAITDPAVEAGRTMPIAADYRDLVMVEIPNSGSLTATMVNLDSDEDIVQIDDVTSDDNLDDWVTHEVDRRNSVSSSQIPKTDLEGNASRDDDESSECSEGTCDSDNSSWAGEPVPERTHEDQEDLTPAAEELPSDYPQGYLSSSRVYVHQRNNEANKSLTVVLFVVLTVVSAVAFGHFRGTTVVTRHSHYGAAFEAVSLPASSNVLSDIQKDQIEILKQLQQVLNIQGDLKQKISTLEDENKDLRMRLLESRRKCTRILHRSSSAEPPVVSGNASDDLYGGDVAVTPVSENQPIFDFHPQPVKREAIALPLSLSAVVRAKSAAHSIRTNFQPIDVPAPAAGQSASASPKAPPQRPRFVDPRVESLKLKRSAFRTPPDRFMRIPKEQVDFVMIEDVVVPREVLFGASIPAASRPISVEETRETHIPEYRTLRQPVSVGGNFGDRHDARRADDAVQRSSGQWSYSGRPKEYFPVRPKERADVTEQQAVLRQHVEDALFRAPPAKLVNHTTESASWRPAESPTAKACDSTTDTGRDSLRQSTKIREKVDSVKADIRREKDRVTASRKSFRDSSAWKNVSDRADRKPGKKTKEHHKSSKYSSDKRPCRNGLSDDGFCFLKPNKYRKPDREGCKSQFWSSLPAFIRKHFAQTEKLERVFRGLGTDIVHSKVFKKVMEEVPKKFKISSDWLDCQWNWWQNFARRERQSVYSDCAGYLTTWQRRGTGKDQESARRAKERESAYYPRMQKEDSAQRPFARTTAEKVDSSQSNWFFRRASDRAEFREKVATVGRRMGNLTSWFFQRAKDRAQQRTRFFRDDDYADMHRHHHSERHHNSGIPSDPIYEFLKHRAAWRRTEH